jgi:prepilin-type N-terminal cleavage/methylation domain-containing protein
MNNRRNDRSGFSLIEVMVVIAIIAGLIGGVTLTINVASKKRLETVTKARLAALASALEQMKDPSRLGAYPPTLTEAVHLPRGGAVGKSLGAANDKNVGIETLWVVCHMKGLCDPVQGFDEDGAVLNTDADNAATNIGELTKSDLFEYADAWGNPFVYFHARDYKNPQRVEQYVLADGQTTVKAAPKPSAVGGFAREGAFQLFSMGADGKPGTEDDLHWGE